MLQELPNRANWLMLSHHRPEKDPRLEWIRSYGWNGLKISVLACDSDIKHEILQVENRSATVSLTVPQQEWIGDDEEIHQILQNYSDDKLVRNLSWILWHQHSNRNGLIRHYETFLSESGAVQMYYKTRHLALITATLIEAAKRFDNYQGIIAASFETLLAGAIIKLRHGCPLVFDAHEYHSEEDSEMEDQARQLWKKLEQSLLNYTDARFIVSRGLADLASAELGKSFLILPNAMPKGTTK